MGVISFGLESPVLLSIITVEVLEALFSKDFFSNASPAG